MTPFEVFWREYPRRIGRFKAEQMWKKMSAEEQQQAIRSLPLWKQTAQWQSEGGAYIPHGSTFLHQKRFLDEPWSGAFEQPKAPTSQALLCNECGGSRYVKRQGFSNNYLCDACSLFKLTATERQTA
jgi:hypothetical protein